MESAFPSLLCCSDLRDTVGLGGSAVFCLLGFVFFHSEEILILKKHLDVSFWKKHCIKLSACRLWNIMWESSMPLPSYKRYLNCSCEVVATQLKQWWTSKQRKFRGTLQQTSMVFFSFFFLSFYNKLVWGPEFSDSVLPGFEPEGGAALSGVGWFRGTERIFKGTCPAQPGSFIPGHSGVPSHIPCPPTTAVSSALTFNSPVACFLIYLALGKVTHS